MVIYRSLPLKFPNKKKETVYDGFAWKVKEFSWHVLICARSDWLLRMLSSLKQNSKCHLEESEIFLQNI